MKTKFALLLFIALFGTVGTAESWFYTATPCETYENYEECDGEDLYVGPDGQAYDDQGNPVNDSDGGYYEDEPRGDESGYLEGDI